MAKRIRWISDLPDWFKLEKYNCASSLDAAGWYEQLYIRQSCFEEIIPDLQSSKEPDVSEDLIQENIEILDLIRSQPIVDVTSNILLKNHFLSGTLRNLKQSSESHQYSFGVHTMTPQQLIAMEMNLLPERQELLNEWKEKFPNNKWQKQNLGKYKNWFDKPITDSFMFDWGFPLPTMVNIHLPDTVLIQSFKHWLNSVRQESHFKAASIRYRSPDFDKWHTDGILPWLDLTIWSKQMDVTIPNRVMADAIYPYGEGGEEAIRKTTAPKAEKLMEDSENDGCPLTSLAAQVAMELYNKNPEE